MYTQKYLQRDKQSGDQTCTLSGRITFTHFYQYVHLVLWLRQALSTVGWVALALGHKGHLSVALTWGCAGDVAEELPDAGVTQGTPEGASREHVEDGVEGAADEDQCTGDDDHGRPDTVQVFCCVREGIFNAQDYEGEDVSDMMRCPANGKHDHDACDQNCGLAFGLEGHLSYSAAQAAVADHEDGEW